ncbi:MAG: FMN-binding glutamate synthase family protein [Pseudomonadota bacterium]
MGAVSIHFFWPFLVTSALVLLGLWDLAQTRHSLLRNYPIIAHMRWLFEGIRPEIRQYFGESDIGGRPFDRDTRSLVYERAKNEHAEEPFGTELDVYQPGYEWFTHSIAPKAKSESEFRVRLGGADCKRPYEISRLNVSAMSFGALSANAIRALNLGAKMGGFAHDTGEGGLTQYHLENGGDIIWELGSGYFGCRTKDGKFDPEKFRDKSNQDQVKAIHIKLSQGAKPGLGGVMPGAKVTREIAEIRGVPEGVKCVSPPYHSAFSTPRELIEFVAQLRELSDGRPTGFKLCIGREREFLAICKAMIDMDTYPDFITIDGGEGGTGAAPLEFENNVGAPLTFGLVFAHNALVGAGLRDRIKIGCSGKVASGADIAKRVVQGADYCNAARAMMFALGCIQAQRCHTNHCPVGVATQDPRREKALVVPDKAERVHQFHANTVDAFNEIIAAIGLADPAHLEPHHLRRRINFTEVRSYEDLFAWLEPGELIAGTDRPDWHRIWTNADPDSFRFQPQDS